MIDSSCSAQGLFGFDLQCTSLVTSLHSLRRSTQAQTPGLPNASTRQARDPSATKLPPLSKSSMRCRENFCLKVVQSPARTRETVTLGGTAAGTVTMASAKVSSCIWVAQAILYHIAVVETQCDSNALQVPSQNLLGRLSGLCSHSSRADLCASAYSLQEMAVKLVKHAWQASFG